MEQDSREVAKTRRNLEELSSIAVDCGYRLHVKLGPGLLESAYEIVFADLLKENGLQVEWQVPIPIRVFGKEFNEGFQADLIIENSFLIELKSVEMISTVHSKQVLTYLKLLNFPLGLLINFGAATFKEGCKRIVHQHTNFASSRLRVHKSISKQSQ